jgi:hypothetical protein
MSAIMGVDGAAAAKGPSKAKPRAPLARQASKKGKQSLGGGDFREQLRQSQMNASSMRLGADAPKRAEDRVSSVPEESSLPSPENADDSSSDDGEKSATSHPSMRFSVKGGQKEATNAVEIGAPPSSSDANEISAPPGASDANEVSAPPSASDSPAAEGTGEGEQSSSVPAAGNETPTPAPEAKASPKTVDEFLESLGLSRFANELKDIGAECLDDLDVVERDDLESIGMSADEIDRYFKAMQSL